VYRLKVGHRLPGYTASHCKGEKFLYIYLILARRAITSYGSPKEKKFMGIICYYSCVFNLKSVTQLT